MSLLENLRPKRGSTGYRKRVGRGTGSGLGGTAGKGHKGQKARTGGKVRWGFEGGQTPLMRRLPKFGFSNVVFETAYDVFNLSQLAALGKDVNPESLEKAGLLKYGRVKILAKGDAPKGITVRAHKFSAKAKEAIEKAGGKTEIIVEAISGAHSMRKEKVKAKKSTGAKA